MNINRLLENLSHHYLLVAIAAVLFFAVKALLGYLTYRHYDRRFNKLEKLLQEMRGRHDNGSP